MGIWILTPFSGANREDALNDAHGGCGCSMVTSSIWYFLFNLILLQSLSSHFQVFPRTCKTKCLCTFAKSARERVLCHRTGNTCCYAKQQCYLHLPGKYMLGFSATLFPRIPGIWASLIFCFSEDPNTLASYQWLWPSTIIAMLDTLVRGCVSTLSPLISSSVSIGSASTHLFAFHLFIWINIYSCTLFLRIPSTQWILTPDHNSEV